MRRNLLAILLFFLLPPSFLFAQCIDSKTLTDRLNHLQSSSDSQVQQQLQELLSYETGSEHCPYRNDSSRILLLQRISKLYVENHEYLKAIQYCLKAIALLTSNFKNPAINPAYQIRSYYNLASIYNQLNITSEKMRAYDSCISVAKRLKIVNLLFMYALREKVRYQNNIGDYNLCISQAETGEKFSRQFVAEPKFYEYGDSTSYSLDFAIEKANALLVLHRSDEAEAFVLTKIKSCNQQHVKKYLGSLYELLAMTKMQQKNYGEALRYFSKALQNYKTYKDTLAYKDNLHNIGYLYHDINKDYDKALLYYKKAIKIKVIASNRSNLDSINSLNIYSNIGDVYALKGQFDSAQINLQRAFNLIKKGANETDVLESSLDDFIRNQKVEYLTGLFINKGNAFYKQYLVTKKPQYIQQAIRMYQLTDRLLEKIKANQLEIQSKLFWRRITHPFYEQAIDVCIRAGKHEEAFYFFERSRAILLYDQMKEQRGASETDILKQQQLRNKVSEIELQLATIHPDSPDFRRLQNLVEDYKSNQMNLVQQIKIRSPLYFKNFIDSNFITLDETRRGILKDHTLVEIFNGDSCVYSMIVTAKEIYFNRINKAAYDSTIHQCLSYMSNPYVTNNKTQFNSFLKKSNYLYQLIFRDKNLPNGPVIFSVDGHHFPFETLVTNSSVSNPIYFIQKHAVSYAYSARYLMSQFSQNPSFTPGDFLGVAPVKFPEHNHLSVLPGSDDAIRSVAPLFMVSDTLVNGRATKKNFLDKFGRYRIMQLFSHSSDSSAMGEPVIYFADEPLYLSELNNVISPATKLIVLSACETGNGEFFQGEGVFSFNRAFAALGIPACINNLWSVDNETTYRLTNLFYKNLSQGQTTDEALRSAKLEFIRTASAKKKIPYFWAATILAGKAEAIQFDKRSGNTKTGLVVGIIVIVLLLIISRIIVNKKRKQRYGSSTY